MSRTELMFICNLIWRTFRVLCRSNNRLTHSLALPLVFAYCFIPISIAQAAALDANKSFTPATVYPSEISTVVIELQNSSVFPGAGASFTDVLPNNVFVATTPNATTTCGGTVTHSNGATSGQLTLSGGIIPAGDGTNPGKCRVTIDATTPSKGTYINTIAASDVTATVNSVPESNGQASTATLTALINPFTIQITSDKDYTPNSPTSRIYLHGHETGVMTLKLINPNPVPLTDVTMDWDFSDLYVGSWIHLIDGTGGGDCGGTLTITDAVAGDALYRPEVDADYIGGTIPANGSCTITVQMQTRAYSDLSAAERYASFSIAPNTFTTTEGATNANASKTSQTNWGLSIEKRFDGEPLRQVHAVSGTSTSVLSLAYENHEADTVALDVIDIMPTSPGQMTVVSIDSNTCGGTVTTNGGTEINIAGGSIAGSPGSFTPGRCELRATVSVLEDGTYTNDIPAGTTGGHIINAASATLIKTSGAVTITKTKQNPKNYTGDENVYTYTIANLSDPTVGIDVSNLRLRDNFDVISSTGYNYGKILTISQANVMSSTCAGTVFNAAPGDEFFDVSGVSVPKGSSCQINVQVSVKANDEDYTYGAFENIAVKTNAADATEEGVVYDVGANTDQLFGAEVLLEQSILNSFSLTMAFIPDTVNVDGVSRLRYEIISSTITNPAIDNLFLRNTLPTGLTIAASPNFSSTCGGSLNSVPGSDNIEFSGGYMTGNVLTAPINLLTYASSRRCWVELDVQAPLTSGGYTSTIPTDPKLTPLADLEVTGRKIGEIAPYSQFYRSNSDFATLNVLPVEIGVNKTFLTPVIGGGKASRVRITIANNTTGAPSLTGVSLTDLFSNSDMALYSNVDGTFTDTSGSSSGKCRNATITGTPGDQSITLSGAEIDTGGICRFEFNVTANVGGNHINSIAIGDVKSDQGITNNIAVSATLTVDRELNIAKGFNPSNIGPGETTTLSVEVVNSNQAPVNYTGSAVSLIDEMPAGISIQSIVSNSCGGTATIGSQNGNDTIQLSGGSFPAETTCRINALVSAATPGSYTNTIAAASLVTNEGATNPNAVSATLSVNVPPRIVKSFYPSTIGPGMNSIITFRVYNDAALAISGLTFSDTLINMNLTSPTLVGGTCQSVDYTATAGGNTFEVTAGVVPANSNCTITTQVTSSTVGVHDNVTSGADSDQTGLGLPSNIAKLTVQELPVLAKSFTPAIIQAGTVSTLTFTLTNPNDAEVRMESWYYAFQDFFPTGMTVATTPNVTMNCRLGALKNLTYDGVVTAGDVGVTFDFGFVPANGSCTASVDVTVDSAGSYVNTTTAAKTEYLGYTPAATATLLATTGAPPEFDYGDAPTAGTAPVGSGSNNYGEPRHEIVAGLYLGAGLPDADASYQSSATADGDDTDGTDDDDGVSSFPAFMNVDTSYTIPAANISATGTGTLHAWIDFDGDGSFESSEYTSASVTGGTLSGSLTWSGLTMSTVKAGDSFVRLRLTSDATVNALAPASAATDGEVEDYPLTITEPPKSPDVPLSCSAASTTGIVPDGLPDFAFPRGYWAASYFRGNNGNNNAAGNEVFQGEAFWGLGENPVRVTVNGTAANGRWSNTETPTSPILHHPSYVGNTWTDTNPYYQIDYRSKVQVDGIIRIGGDPGDVVDDTIEIYVNGVRKYAYFPGGGAPDPRPTDTVAAVVPVFANDDVMVRFINLGYIGGMTFEFEAPGYDCSDAPSSYSGAAHVKNETLYLGSVVDIESTDIASPAANADGADDDGVTIPTLVGGGSATIPVIVNQPSANNGYLQGWIDWNGNGDFGDPGEQVATNLRSATAGSSTINVLVNVPTDATTNQTYARFRWSSTSSLDANSTASNGEVEDYALNLLTLGTPPASCSFDGDVWYNSATELRRYNIYSGQDDLMTSLTNTHGDIAFAADGTLYASNFSSGGSGYEIYSMNQTTGTVLTVLSGSEISAVNSLSGDQFGWLYFGSGQQGNSKNNLIYRFLPGQMSIPQLWLDLADHGLDSGMPSGDFVFIDGAAYVAYYPDEFDQSTPVQLLKVDNLASDNSLTPSSTVTSLGAIGLNIWGMAGNENGDIFAVSGSGNQLFRVQLSPFSVTTVASLAGAPYGATGRFEASGLACPGGLEFGDAPDTYGTLNASDGARHISTDSTLFLGSGVADLEPDGQPSATANEDDMDGGDDDDGVSIIPILSTLDRNYRITVTATNTTALPGRLIAWLDFDRNGTFEADEAAARVVPAGTTAGSFIVTWASTPPDIQQGTTYLRLRYTTDAMNAGDSRGEKSNGEVEDYVLTIGATGATLTGRVFIDANSDTVNNAGEAGIGSTEVVLFDAASGTCRSATTNANGDYTFLDLADGSYEVFQAHGETTPIPQNCVAAPINNPPGYQSTTPDTLTVEIAGADVADKDFGEVAGTNSTTTGNTGVGILFTPDHQSAILPGNVVFYAHKFSTDAEGAVRFTTNGSNNTATGWAHQIYRDSNCNGALDGTESNAAIENINFGIATGAKLCIIDKVYAPSNVPAQDSYRVETTATFSYAGGSPAPAVLKVTDVTTAGQTATPTTTAATPEVGESRLVLRKTVENLTQVTAETETANRAAPGDFLKYRIYYRNTGTGPITDLKVNDSVPAFTGFVVSSESCDVTPTGMTCNPTRNVDVLNWEFTGSLIGGAQGNVSYEVMVDN